MKWLPLLVLVLACSSTSTEDKKLFQQSVEAHEAALSMGEQVKDNLSRLSSYLDSQEISSEMWLKDSVEVLNLDYSSWQESIVEVPGHEHEHHDHDGHDHSHDHSSDPDLTPEMVLEIQQDLRIQAERLNARVEEILNTIQQDSEVDSDE